MQPPQVVPACAIRCELGENPIWDKQKSCLYWTDIKAGKLYRLDLGATKPEVIYEGDSVGGFTLQTDGSLLLFRVRDIAILPPLGNVIILRAFHHEGMDRFNDVIADPEGRVFAGTIGEHPKCGVYRLDLDGKVTEVISGTGCSNGMGFTANLKWMFWTCSTKKAIYKYPYNCETGELGKRELFYQASEDEGIPDGLVVDSAGHVWSARWGGGRIIEHDLNGKVESRIALPAKKVTSLCFGGEKMDHIFISTAQVESEAESEGGCIFTAHLPITGAPEFQSKIGIRS